MFSLPPPLTDAERHIRPEPTTGRAPVSPIRVHKRCCCSSSSTSSSLFYLKHRRLTFSHLSTRCDASQDGRKKRTSPQRRIKLIPQPSSCLPRSTDNDQTTNEIPFRYGPVEAAAQHMHKGSVRLSLRLPCPSESSHSRPTRFSEIWPRRGHLS